MCILTLMVYSIVMTGGFGMTDDEEINLYGAIDRKGKVVKKFTLKR